MPLIYTEDREYLFAIDDYNDMRNGKPQSVFYRVLPDGSFAVVADRHSAEAGLGDVPPVVPSPSPSRPGPAPVTPTPEPSVPLSRELRVFRVTEPRDGTIIPRMYSYWSNAYILGTAAYVFCGTDRGPQLLSVDLVTGNVARLGEATPYGGETEGWYWTIDGWITLIHGPRLRRFNPFTRQEDVLFDISDLYPGCDLWQAHSSDDGRTHSATVRRIVSEGKYPYIATVVCRNGKLIPFPAEGDLDESHISGNGSDVIIEENNDMRAINLETRATRRLGDWDGALAHIDCGPDYIVGEADKPDPGRCDLYRLDRPFTPGNRLTLFLTTNMGHLSVKNGLCLRSTDAYLSLVSMNGAGEVVLLRHGGETGTYDKQVKANLDPTGRVATYMIFKNGRFDVYLAVLPA